jgi:glycosyltransferase involved in cell wall biosynthesis
MNLATIPVSCLVLTYNEEGNLPMCLASLSWCRDVVVLDSLSKDRTVAIAKEMGARVYERAFDDFASQRNYGLHDIPYDNEWVFMVDADELTPPELVEEIGQAVTIPNNPVSLYRMRRKDYLFGSWMRAGAVYGTWFGRLVKPAEVRVERAVNEQYVTDGETGELQNDLMHFSYNAGFHDWFAEQNLHSSMEAERMGQGPDVSGIPWRAFFSDDPVERRAALKAAYMRSPGRPVLMFLYLYFWRKGWRDGRHAFTHCLLRAIYEYMIDLKRTEHERRRKGEPI